MDSNNFFSARHIPFLFLLVLSLAIGEERGDILGVSFINFLAPGLIAMQVIQQFFAFVFLFHDR